MSNCLITKLKGSVSDPSLLKLGELRFNVTSVTSPTKNSQYLYVVSSQPTKASIVGEGHFSDNNLAANIGKIINITTSEMFLSNGNYDVSIENRYNISAINCNNPSAVGLDIKGLEYCLALKNLNLPSSKVKGNISSLKDCAAMEILNLSNSSVQGSLDACLKMENLSSLSFTATSIYGDISSLRNCAKLKRFVLQWSKSSSSKVLYGDLSTLPSSFAFLGITGTNSEFTWNTRTGADKSIIAIEGYPYINNVDKFLQDQATCTANPVSSDTYAKTIQVKGSRTTASDAAISTLQSKGFTVVVNA